MPPTPTIGIQRAVPPEIRFDLASFCHPDKVAGNANESSFRALRQPSAASLRSDAHGRL